MQNTPQNTVKSLTVSVPQAARILNFCDATLRHRIKDGTIPEKYVSRLGERGNIRINKQYILSLAGVRESA